MNPARFTAAIEAVRAELTALPGIKSVVLFGSVARGTAHEESDIDLLIECDPEFRDPVRKTLYRIGDRFDITFSPVFYRDSERQLFDTQFLESIVRHGRVLFGSLPVLTPSQLDLQPLRLVSYQSGRLVPRKRVRFLREIDGYETRKRVGRKTYVFRKPGFLKEVGGWRVGRGAVIVPEESIDAFDEILRKYGVTRSIIAIWSQRP